jgi:hypothetical protein
MTEQNVAFDGKCAFALSAGAGPDKAPAGDPKHALEVDGTTYLFKAAVPKLLFKAIPGSAARAQRKWAASQGA